MKNRRIVLAVAWLGLVILGRFLKISVPIGSQSASLSCFAVVLPLIAYFFPTAMSLLLVGGMYLVFPLPLTAGIPTLMATLSWRKGGKWLHVAFPLCAMVLFSVVQPGAWLYTLYWLIPVGLHFVRPNVMTRALQSTFVQHATGSLVWVCLVPLASEQWLALIPVVAVERLIAASLSVGVIGCLAFAAQLRLSNSPA